MTKRMSLVAMVLVLVNATLAGCASEQPGVASRSGAIEGLAPGAADSLVNADATPDACRIYIQSAPVGTVTVTRMMTRGDGTPLPALIVSVCAAEDTRCEYPLATTSTDAAGRFSVEVSSGFDGYYQITGADIDPTLLYLPPYVTSSTDGVRLASPVEGRHGPVAGLDLGGTWLQSPDCQALPRQVPARLGFRTVLPPPSTLTR